MGLSYFQIKYYFYSLYLPTKGVQTTTTMFNRKTIFVFINLFILCFCAVKMDAQEARLETQGEVVILNKPIHLGCNSNYKKALNCISGKDFSLSTNCDVTTKEEKSIKDYEKLNYEEKEALKNEDLDFYNNINCETLCNYNTVKQMELVALWAFENPDELEKINCKNQDCADIKGGFLTFGLSTTYDFTNVELDCQLMVRVREPSGPCRAGSCMPTFNKKDWLINPFIREGIIYTNFIEKIFDSNVKINEMSLIDLRNNNITTINNTIISPTKNRNMKIRKLKSKSNGEIKIRSFTNLGYLSSRSRQNKSDFLELRIKLIDTNGNKSILSIPFDKNKPVTLVL